MKKFYVYTHSTDDGRVFYVGKGCGNRAYEVEGRSKLHDRVSKKHGCNVSIVWYATCEEQAFAIEMMNIDFHGTYHYDDPKGIGCNFTKGGEGVSGHRHNDETKEVIKQASLGRKHSELAKEKMSKASKGKPKSESHRKSMSLVRKGKVPSNKGTKLTSEQRAEVSRLTKEAMAKLDNRHSEETKKKIGESNKGKKRSPETIEKLRLSHLGKGKPWSPERRARFEKKRKASK